MINNSHEIRKATPPIGVIAPRTLIPETLNTYKLPEKMMIPINMSHPDQESRPETGTFRDRIPIANIPNA